MSLTPFLPVGCQRLQGSVVVVNVDCPQLKIVHERGESSIMPGVSLNFDRGEPLQLDAKSGPGTVLVNFQRSKI